MKKLIFLLVLMGSQSFAQQVTTTSVRSASDLTTGALVNGVTATTQSQGDNSTKVSTTAYVDVNYSLLGDTEYGSAAGTRARLAGNITTTKKYYSQTGNGSVSAAPSWAQISLSDLSNGTLSSSSQNALAISDSTTNADSSPLSLRHTLSSGTAANGIASRLDFEVTAADASLPRAAHIQATWSDATAKTSTLDFYTRLSGGSMTKVMSFSNALAALTGALTTTKSVAIGSSSLTVPDGGLGMLKITADGSAPGAGGCKFQMVCGTNAGTAKMVVSCGTSATTVTIVDNIGAGVTGC